MAPAACLVPSPFPPPLQGAFTVTSSMPVQYTVTQVNGIFDLNNKVGDSRLQRVDGSSGAQHGVQLFHGVSLPLWNMPVCLRPFTAPRHQPQPLHLLCCPAVPCLTNHSLTPPPLSLPSTLHQALLRGVVPGSFPFVLAPEPQQTVGLRRLIILDDNVHRIYGPQLEKVGTVWLYVTPCCRVAWHCPLLTHPISCLRPSRSPALPPGLSLLSSASSSPPPPPLSLTFPVPEPPWCGVQAAGAAHL